MSRSRARRFTQAPGATPGIPPLAAAAERLRLGHPPPWEWHELRFTVLERDGYVCRYCGARGPETRLQVDHVVPRSAGGPDTLDNLVTACASCNYGKGSRRLQRPAPAASTRPAPRPTREQTDARSRARSAAMGARLAEVGMALGLYVLVDGHFVGDPRLADGRRLLALPQSQITTAILFEAVVASEAEGAEPMTEEEFVDRLTLGLLFAGVPEPQLDSYLHLEAKWWDLVCEEIR